MIFKYSTSPPAVTIPPAPEEYLDWMGHMGTDGRLMLRRAIEWARDHGAEGKVEEAFQTFSSYARANFVIPSQTSVFMKMSVHEKTDEWTVPRIHHDGIYWDPKLNVEDEDRYKIGTLLCGPGTLFWDTLKVPLEVAQKGQEVVYSGMKAKAQELDASEGRFDVEVRK